MLLRQMGLNNNCNTIVKLLETEGIAIGTK